MGEFYKLRENAQRELQAIEEKGLTSANLENAYKLTEIVKGVDKICAMKDGGYSEMRGGYANDSEDYDSGSSYRRSRSQTTGRYMHRGGYSRDDGRSGGYSRLSGDDSRDMMEEYREMKKDYSNSRDGGSKRRMLDALDDWMGNTYDMLKQVVHECDCPEEREIIRKWAREIGNL